MKKLEFNYKNIVVLVISIITIFSTYFVASAQNLIEGNISPKAAFEIPTYPYDLSFKFEDKNDERWFKLNVNNTTNLKIHGTNGDDGIYELYEASELEKENPEALVYEDFFGDGDKHYIKVHPGNYYIRLRPDTRYNGWKEKIFKIRIDFLEEDEYENNDTWKSAKKIDVAKDYKVNLYGKNDEDWFKFKVTETQTLKMYGTNGDDGIYELYEASELEQPNPEALVYEDFFGDGDKHYIKIHPGNYYIRLRPDNRYNGWNEKIFKIRIDFLEEDKYENNDTWKNAVSMTTGKYYDINLYGKNDKDWFTFKIDEEKILKIHGTNGDDGIYELYTSDELLKSNPNALRSVDFFGDGDKDYIKLQPGKYYIRLRPDTRYNGWNEKIFNIRIDLLDDDDYENNDTWQKATNMTIGKNYDIKLFVSDDEDWFKFELDESQTLKFTGKNGDDGIYELFNEESLKDKSYKTIRYIDFFGDNDTNYIKLVPGKYYVRLRPDTRYKGWNEKIFTIKADLLEEDKYENNDTWQNAADFKLGEDKTITLNASNDEDWFKLNLTQKESLKLKLDSSVSNSYRYYVYEQSSLQQGSTSYLTQGSVRTNGTAGGFSFDSGTYYVKLVNDSSSNKYESEIKMTINRNGEDIIRPTVTALSSSYNFDVNSSIEFEFSKPMDITTLNKSNISVKCYNDPIDFDIEYDEVDNKLILTPYNRLNYSSEYTVDISSKVKSRDNNLSMAKDYTWEFTTREKRASDSKVGIIKGNLILSDNLKGLAIAAKVELYSGNTKKTTVKVQSNGSYVINNVEPGTYTIKSKLPGFLDDSNRVTVTENNESKVNLTPVYGDSNNDGIIDIYDLTNTAVNYDRRSK